MKPLHLPHHHLPRHLPCHLLDLLPLLLMALVPLRHLKVLLEKFRDFPSTVVAIAIAAELYAEDNFHSLKIICIHSILS